MADSIWENLTDTEKQQINKFYEERETASTQLDFLPAMFYKSHHDYKKPAYSEGDLTDMAVIQSSGMIRLDAPSIIAYPPNKIVYNKSTHTYTKTTVYDGEEITDWFRLTVKNEGTEQEEVTRLTFSNGEYIDFEGFNV